MGVPVRPGGWGACGSGKSDWARGSGVRSGGSGPAGSVPTVVLAVAPAVVAGHAAAVPAAVHLPVPLSSDGSGCGSGPARYRRAAS